MLKHPTVCLCVWYIFSLSLWCDTFLHGCVLLWYLWSWLLVRVYFSLFYFVGVYFSLVFLWGWVLSLFHCCVCLWCFWSCSNVSCALFLKMFYWSNVEVCYFLSFKMSSCFKMKEGMIVSLFCVLYGLNLF